MSGAKAKRVLVVDDEPGLREMLAANLELDGFEVVTAANGLEALRLLRALTVRPSLILLDLMMPVLDGYRFLEAQRADPELAQIPVAIITAGHGVDRVRLGTTTPVVRKPIKLAQLLELMHELRAAGSPAS